MPKRNTIFGSERTNLMYSLIGRILDAGSISVSELADQFELTEREVTDAIRTISVTETGTELDYSPFMIDEDLLKEGIAEFNSYPLDLEVPRLSARQVAAISAGLRYLEGIPGFSRKDEIMELLGLLNASSSDEVTETISFSKAHIDSDVALLRQAISEQKAIRCEYINASGIRNVRTMDPLRLESRDPVWYLRAYCHKNLKVTSFRLDRLDQPEILDQPISTEALKAEIPEEIYTPSSTDHTVTLDLAPEAYAMIADFGAIDRNPSKIDGTKRVTIKVRDLETLGPVIAAYGGAAVVVSPAEAHNAVKNFCIRALGQEPNENGDVE
jgi:proteasome accessory factor C